MENVEIARTLGLVADLLEIRGANPFRVRAYRNAVRTVEGLTRPLRRMVAEGEDLTRLPGVGEDISGYIRELVDSGRLSVLDEIREEVPESLAELVRLDGVGPKRARKLWKELDVTSVDELALALDEGVVEELDGIGEKTVEKMRRSIAEFRRHTARTALAEADALVEPLLAYMDEAPGLQRIEVAGSYRRRKETVGDVDLLVVSAEPGGVTDHFVSYPRVERVEMAGESRATVVLRTGLQVDLRVVPGEAYGAALHYFTGSKEHNVAIRKRGVERGLRINEYGVFRVEEDEAPREAEEADPEAGERVGGETEADVFEAVGLVWIPPELREDRGEIEAAAGGELPELVTGEEIRGDLQMHSTWSDGKHSIRAMAEACRDRGYAYMAITDHSQRVTVAGGLDAERLEAQWAEIDGVRKEVEGLEIFRSMEVDILRDGSLDLDEEHLTGLDLVLVSVHSYFDLPRGEQTQRIVRALAHPEVDILAHPTGRRINRRDPYEVEIEEVLSAAREHGVAVELNAHPERLDLKDLHVYRARELGVPVVISTDAHAREDLRYMRYGVEQARRGWLEASDILNARSLEGFRAWLEGDRA